MRPRIDVGYPDRTEIESIIRSHHSRMHDRLGPLIDRFWALWAEKDAGKRDAATPPSARDAIYVFNLALSLADFEANDRGSRLSKSDMAHPFALQTSRETTVMEIQHVERAFKELFHHQLSQVS